MYGGNQMYGAMYGYHVIHAASCMNVQIHVNIETFEFQSDTRLFQPYDIIGALHVEFPRGWRYAFAGYDWALDGADDDER